MCILIPFIQLFCSLFPMLVLGIESSCDETGIALFEATPETLTHPAKGLLAHALHSQITMHQAYGGVVPELASRDHIRRVLPLINQCLEKAGKTRQDIQGIAYTEGPGLAGALLVGTSVAQAIGMALHIPTVGVHHLEGHLLSPMLAANPPQMPFIALLVSGGHTQFMQVKGIGDYSLLGETLDDAAGEAFDKTAKLLGLAYPGGPAVSALAEKGNPARFSFPRPMIHSGHLDLSFAGLKTAVLTQVKKLIGNVTHHTPDSHLGASLNETDKADLCASFVAALVDVLVHKSLLAMKQTGLNHLVVAGGVGANQQLRSALSAAIERKKGRVSYPDLQFCTDNGAMIALAGAFRLYNTIPTTSDYSFNVHPRWSLNSISSIN